MKNTIRRIHSQLQNRFLPLITLLIGSFLSSQVWAQAGGPAAPTPGTAPASKPWVWILLAILLFAIVMLVSLKPGKRSHQD